MDTPEVNTKPVVKSTTEKKAKRKFKMPSAFSILFGIAAIMALLTWIVPSGQYDLDMDGNPIAGTYHRTEKVQEVESEDGTIEEIDTYIDKIVLDQLLPQTNAANNLKKIKL